MINAFADGKMLRKKIESFAWKIKRQELETHLRRTVFENMDSNSYSIISGADGVGKSCALVDTILNLPHPRGVVYIDVVDAKMFSRTLARLINFRYNDYDRDGFIFRVLSVISSSENKIPSVEEEPMATWMHLMTAISDTAVRYKAKFGSSITLVIDAVDTIARYDTEHDTPILESLQTFAERRAEHGVHVVFVTGEGVALQRFMKSAEFSRATVFEVVDVSDDQALSFLVVKNISKETALLAVESYTGGNFQKINEFLSKSTSTTLDEIIRQDHVDLQLVLSSLGLKCDHPMFHLLLQNKSLKISTMDWLNISADTLMALVSANILSRDIDMNYRFHHRSVESFFKMARGGEYPEICA